MTIAFVIATACAGSASVGTAGADKFGRDTGISGRATALPMSAGATAEGQVSATVARPERCPDARRGLAFYRGRYAEHRAKMGAEATQGPSTDGKPSSRRPRKPRNCADAHWLAKVWKQRAHRARLEARRWLSSIGVVVRRLERGLDGTPMAGTGIILEREGRRHHVSPYFMAAVAATESSLGHAACSNNRRNVWGLASCVNSWPVPYFDTWDEAISFYARFLSGRWPGHSTPYSFRGYAACSDCWARKVSYWMGRLFGVDNGTRYP